MASRKISSHLWLLVDSITNGYRLTGIHGVVGALIAGNGVS